MRNHLCTFGPLAVFLSDSFARTTDIYQPELLCFASMAAFGKLHCGGAILCERQLWAGSDCRYEGREADIRGDFTISLISFDNRQGG